MLRHTTFVEITCWGSNRGSYISADVKMSLLNVFEKHDKIQGLWSILWPFHKFIYCIESNKFNNTTLVNVNVLDLTTATGACLILY